MRFRAAVLFLLTAAAASAGYHWIRYSSRLGASQPVYDRYDLAALPDGGTLPFFINDPGVLQLAANDSTTALISQIRAAALAWNAVPTSGLKLAYGGIRNGLSPAMNSPWIEVEFSDELAPGIIALGGPTGRLEPAAGPDGTFTPIVKSLLRLPRNLTSRPSWSERFFLTVVHEFGHTLGLQHSWASGAMSTELTRATTKARPLSADDEAALSMLYPNSLFRQTTGAISGRVTLNGNGVHLASVAAYSARGWAVSTLTHPDGTYRLEGLAPGAYSVYVHPLPPALPGEPQPVNLDLPADPDGRIPPGGAFDLQFYPGTATPQTTVPVTAAQTTANINFSVRARSAVNLHTVQSYSFLGQDTTKPAVILAPNGRGTVVFSGYGATQAAPNFSVNTLLAGDGTLPGTLRAYSAGYLQVDVAVPASGADGPRPLLFTLGDEQYVLPSAYTVVSRTPPAITGLASNPDRTVTLTGQGLNAGTQVWFDGVKGRIRATENGSLIVVAPPAPAGHRSAVAALNPDGQSSLFFAGPAPQFYAHETPEPAAFTVSPSALPAGAETVVEISASGLNFEETPPVIATGSSDVAIERLWVTGPNRALALVSVHPLAASGAAAWTMQAGLIAVSSQTPVLTLTGVRQIYLETSPLARVPLTQGSPVTVQVANGPASAALSSIAVSVADRPAQVLSFLSGQLTFQLPANLPSGPVSVRAVIAGEALPQAILTIAAPAPVILGALGAGGAMISAAAPLKAGDVVSLMVANLYEPGQTIDALNIRLISPLGVSSLEHTIISVVAVTGQPGTGIVQAVLSTQNAGASLLPLVISVDDRPSTVFSINYRP